MRAFVHIRRWGVSGDGLDPLLNRIARNLLIDRYRRTTPHLVPLDNAGDLHDPDQDPTEEVARRQRRHAVQRAIRALPTRHRTAITYTLSGLTPEEVGRQMGIGRNAADALLHRARRSLKEHLSAVRDGAWGFAFAVRLKWDRITRRTGVEAGVADASTLAITHTVIGVATAAAVAVMGFGGGGSGLGGGGLTITPGYSLVPAAAERYDRGSRADDIEAVNTSVAEEPVAAEVRSYRLGPTQTSLSDNGVDTDTQFGPKDRDGNPLISGHGYLHRDRGSADRRKGDLGFFAAQQVCRSVPGMCRSAFSSSSP